ncbi:MAG TPA: radical SAM family heme chaperone HemW, partial [Chitinophagales bacterium]|nr:radical SAM family heme chaperone HemW [Chitinophagales bacterium]
FTLEANPDDLSERKIVELKALQAQGLNRLSIGVQSFFDDDLRYMNRAHNAEEALTAIKRAQDAGFENITIDLIYGTPTMNDERWLQNMGTAFGLKVPHVSSYALTVEPKTALERKIKKGESKPVGEEQSARQFKLLMQQMKAQGYEQYEISNFALPGRYAIHNSNYWFGKKYLGLGPSAHSYNGVSRRWNVRNNINYIEAIDKGILNTEEEVLTETQKINERIMTRLRTKWGLKLEDCGKGVADLIMESLKGVDTSLYIIKEGTIILTDEGKLFADGIAAELFIEEPDNK